MPELSLGLASGCPVSSVLHTVMLAMPHGHLPVGECVSVSL